MRSFALPPGATRRERLLLARMPTWLAALWAASRASGLARPGRPLPALWSPETAELRAYALVQQVEGMAAVGLPPPASLDDMTAPAVIEVVMKGPMAPPLGGPSRVLHLSSLRAAAFALDARANPRRLPWISRAISRIKRLEPRRNRWADILPWDQYLGAAIRMHQRAADGSLPLLARALLGRDAAELSLHLEVSPRLKEGAHIKLNAVLDTGVGLTVRISAADSKTGKAQLRAIHGPAAGIIRDYLVLHRPVLAVRATTGGGGSDALWLGRGGQALLKGSYAVRLKRLSMRELGKPACANGIRRTCVSRPGIADADRPAMLGQAAHSPVAAACYTRRSRSAVCAQFQAIRLAAQTSGAGAAPISTGQAAPP